MNSYIFIRIINFIANILVLVIIVDAIVSFFLSPYHPLRSFLDRIVQPLLRPIRRVVPLIGNLDFSPVVLIIAIELIAYILGILIQLL
jgi:YggT family protein